MDRLTAASHPLLLDPQVFAYDAVGNRTTNGSAVNAGNQLTADSNFAYQYDDNGNLTRKTLLVTGNYTQYNYDAENRLVKVEEFAAGNPTAITTSTYRYDGLGRRIEKVANGQTTRYIYDGEDILLEYDGAGRIKGVGSLFLTARQVAGRRVGCRAVLVWLLESWPIMFYTAGSGAYPCLRRRRIIRPLLPGAAPMHRRRQDKVSHRGLLSRSGSVV